MHTAESLNCNKTPVPVYATLTCSLLRPPTAPLVIPPHLPPPAVASSRAVRVRPAPTAATWRPISVYRMATITPCDRLRTRWVCSGTDRYNMVDSHVMTNITEGKEREGDGASGMRCNWESRKGGTSSGRILIMNWNVDCTQGLYVEIHWLRCGRYIFVRIF